MKLQIKSGTTSQIVNLFILDSASTTGAGKTGLVFNSASLTAYFAKPGAAAVAITLVTQTPTGAYASGGFVEIDATNMPGWYRFDIPNAVLSATPSAQIHFKGATGMVPLPIEIEVVAYDPMSSSNLGLSNLDATISSRSTFAGGAVTNVIGAVGSVTGNVGGNVLGSVDSVTNGVTVLTNADKTGYALSSNIAEVALALTTRAENAAIPAANASLAAKINFLFQYFRNLRTVTASVETLKADDGTTTVGTAALTDDGTTFTKGEIG